MRRIKAFSVVLGVVSATLVAATPAAAEDKEKLVERIVAKADPDLLEVVVTTRAKNGAPEFDRIRVPNVAAAKRVVNDMVGRSGVVAVEMNQKRYAVAINDPLLSSQWALDRGHFDLPTLYNMTINDATRPIVAVVDTGVMANHPDLYGRVKSGANFSGSSSSADRCGHGTHVAGIVAAKTNNGTGIAGMSRTAVILPVKVLGDECWGDAFSVSEGIKWAAQRSHVINMSFASSQQSDAEANAIAYARSLGRVLVAAAGNETCTLLGCSRTQTTYPAAHYGVIGVAAVDWRWNVASFSNYGSWVDVAAPGVSILSTVPPGADPGCGTSSYCRMSGTSMAAPHVAALAAMALGHCRWGASTVVNRIIRRASHYPTRDDYTGFGIIRPKAVLSCT